MTVSGPGFLSLQVRDVARSAAFYEEYLGFTRQAGPPGAAVFATQPAAFAVREPFPGVDLDSDEQLGFGIGIWLHADDVQKIHDRFVVDGVAVSGPPVDSPFGHTFTFVDPDGYRITLHDRA